MPGTTLRRSPTAFTARRAGVLLVVLLSHLAFMVSPVHALARHAESPASGHDVANAAHGHCVTCTLPAASLREPAHFGDCGIQAAPASAGFSNGFPSTLTLSGRLGPWPCGSGWPRDLPEAHGPPRLAEAQAFLQVFRT